MFRKRTHLESSPSSFATTRRILLFLWNYSYFCCCFRRWWFTKRSGWWDLSSRKCRSATMPNMPRYWRFIHLFISIPLDDFTTQDIQRLTANLHLICILNSLLTFFRRRFNCSMPLQRYAKVRPQIMSR